MKKNLYESLIFITAIAIVLFVLIYLFSSIYSRTESGKDVMNVVAIPGLIK